MNTKIEFHIGKPMTVKGPCGKNIEINVLYGSGTCSKCGDICHFDYIKEKDDE